MPDYKTYCQRGAKGKQESSKDSDGNVINAKDFSPWRRIREARNIEALFTDEHANIVREKWLEQSGDVEAGAQRVAHQSQHKDDVNLDTRQRPAEKGSQHSPWRNPPRRPVQEQFQPVLSRNLLRGAHGLQY